MRQKLRPRTVTAQNREPQWAQTQHKPGSISGPSAVWSSHSILQGDALQAAPGPGNGRQTHPRPRPWLPRVCRTQAARSSPTKDSTRIQVRCLSKQDRVREDTTALRDCCLAPATRRHEASLWIMSREHKGDGYWTVANLYKQKG